MNTMKCTKCNEEKHVNDFATPDICNVCFTKQTNTIEETKKMDLENRMYVETDSAHNLRLEDITAIRNGEFAEPCLRLSDAIRIAKEITAERDKYREALESIANEEGSSCQRCEGNGSLWADGAAHLPSYGGKTVRCGNCGGEGRIFEDIKQIAIDAIATDKDGE